MKQPGSPRAQRFQRTLLKASVYLEIVCALILIVAILVAFLDVPKDMYSLYLDNGFDLDDFIEKSFELVIGVELLKMFCRHNLDSIVEVLLFAVARQIVIEHLPMPECLLGIIAVAILYAVRKFLFIPVLDSPCKSEKKLELDDIMKKEIADGIAAGVEAYKKEHPDIVLREKAEQGVFTADPGLGQNAAAQNEAAS